MSHCRRHLLLPQLPAKLQLYLAMPIHHIPAPAKSAAAQSALAGRANRCAIPCCANSSCARPDASRLQLLALQMRDTATARLPRSKLNGQQGSVVRIKGRDLTYATSATIVANLPSLLQHCCFPNVWVIHLDLFVLHLLR